MPYYLVTQTSLVEGADEVEAARKVLAKLKSDSAVRFTVKHDEETIRQVTVANVPAWGAAQPTAQDPRSSPKRIQDIVAEASAVNPADANLSKRPVLSARSVILGLSLFAAGVTAGLVIMALFDRTHG